MARINCSADLVAELESLKGLKFGKLAVLSLAAGSENPPYKYRKYNWQCDCGAVTPARLVDVKNGNTTSCGCYKAEATSKTHRKHGRSNNRGQKKADPTYAAWVHMRQRCFNPESKQFEDWGGRGITVCERYSNSFDSFLQDIGEKPGNLTLDRVNVNGCYSCGQCEQCRENGWTFNLRWATARTQGLNQRDTVYVTYDGKTQSLNEWAVERGLKPRVVRERVTKLGYTPLQALGIEPGVRHWNKKCVIN